MTWANAACSDAVSRANVYIAALGPPGSTLGPHDITAAAGPGGAGVHAPGGYPAAGTTRRSCSIDAGVGAAALLLEAVLLVELLDAPELEAELWLGRTNHTSSATAAAAAAIPPAAIQRLGGAT